MQGRSVWFDFAANRNRLSTRAGVDEMVHRCKEAGLDTIILGVRDDHGLAPYPSRVLGTTHHGDPKYPGDYDLVQSGIDAARAHGMRIFAAYPTFCEGHLGTAPVGMAFAHPDWVVHLMGCQDGQVGLRPATDPDPSFRSPTAIDAHSLVWVNPAHPEVVAHEIAAITELMDRYPLDGIVLDRARYLGVAADFSPTSRRLFEAHLGERLPEWPGSVAALRDGQPKPAIVPGPYYPQWMEWRAANITAFMRQVRAVLDRTPGRVFANYTGSWYPLYDQMGVNWADPDTVPPYPHAGPGYQATGFARVPDLSISGVYYPEVTEQEALDQGKPYWYSVRGAARMAREVTRDARPIWGGLFLLQYRDQPDRFQEAVRGALEASGGLMLFDLCYLADYDWWEALSEALAD